MLETQRQKSILIVEDGETLQKTLAYNLEPEGYTVSMAADGQTALKVARSYTFALIILDLMLPELDGLSVCHRKPHSGNVEYLTSDDLSLDMVARRAYKEQKELELSFKEFDLLAELIRSRGFDSRERS